MLHDYQGAKEPTPIKFHEIRAGDMIVVETWVTVQEGSRTREIRTKTTGVADYQDYYNITWFAEDGEELVYRDDPNLVGITHLKPATVAPAKPMSVVGDPENKALRLVRLGDGELPWLGYTGVPGFMDTPWLSDEQVVDLMDWKGWVEIGV